jgi:hypothetical protein
VELYDFYKSRITACEYRIQQHLETFDDRSNGKPLPKPLFRSGGSRPWSFFEEEESSFGFPKAITATAHKIARIFYNMLKIGVIKSP